MSASNCLGGQAQATPQDPRSPPLHGRDCHASANFRARNSAGDDRWLGPQTVLEGRPPSLMEAGTEGRCAASLFGARPCGAGHRATQGEALVHLRHAPEGSLGGPERESADSLTPKSGQLSLAATRRDA